MRRLLISTLSVASLGLGCAPQTTPTDACKGRLPGDLVFTEVLNDPDGTDTGKEFIEIFNTTGTPVDVKGMTLTVSSADGTGAKSHIIRAGTVEGRSYFTMGDIRSGPNPEWINYSYADTLGALPNSKLKLQLKCQTTVLDEMTLNDTSSPNKSRQLDGSKTIDAAANDVETNFCDSPNLSAAGSFSSPGQQNPACPVVAMMGQCLDNGTSRNIVSPSVGQLFIAEVMADPKAVADTAGEWIELHASAAFDLNGVVVSSGSSKLTFTDANCLHVNANSEVLLAHSDDTTMNGGLPKVMGTFSFALPQAGGVLSVFAPDMSNLDDATYPKAIAGVSSQLNPELLNSTANDESVNFCPGTLAIGSGGDKGTPGAANTACPMMATPGQCIDPDTSVARDVVAPQIGDLVISEIMNDPKISETTGEWFEVYVKRDCDLNGVVMRTGTSSATIASAACLKAATGESLVMAKSADPIANGGIANVTATFTFALSNSGGSLSLESDAGVVDLMAFASTSGNPEGASRQLPTDKLDATMNDVAANFCPTPPEKTFGPDLSDGGVDGGSYQRGTPGTDNVLCP